MLWDEYNKNTTQRLRNPTGYYRSSKWCSLETLPISIHFRKIKAFLKYIFVFYIFFTFFLTKYPAFYSIAKYSEFYCRSQQNIFFHTLANLSVTDAHSATFLAIVANLQINRYSSFFFTSQKKLQKRGWVLVNSEKFL